MPTFDDPVADATEASAALRGLAHATRQFADPADTYPVIGDLLSGLGLTQVMAGGLWAVTDEPTGTPMKQLAEVLACDRSNATLVAAKLEAAGLAERITDPTDRRVRVLRLTPAGTAKRRELVSAIGAASGLHRLDDTGRRALAEALAQVLQT